MRKPFLALAFVSTLLVSTANAAEINMRPGLWEITTTSDLLRLVPEIPPDQLQNLMDLAKQNGFDIPPIQNGAATSNTCITQEMADQKTLPVFYQNQLGCSAKNATRTGNKYRLDFVCASAQLQGNGTAEGTLTSREGFSGRTAFDGVAQGIAVKEQAAVSGRWISSSCEAAKPQQ